MYSDPENPLTEWIRPVGGGVAAITTGPTLAKQLPRLSLAPLVSKQVAGYLRLLPLGSFHYRCIAGCQQHRSPKSRDHNARTRKYGRVGNEWCAIVILATIAVKSSSNENWISYWIRLLASFFVEIITYDSFLSIHLKRIVYKEVELDWNESVLLLILSLQF